MKGGSATANAFAKAEGDDAKAAAAANAESDGGYAEANAVAIAKSEDNDDKHYGNYYDPPHYYGRDHDDLICKDEYKCVAKGTFLLRFAFIDDGLVRALQGRCYQKVCEERASSRS